MKKSILMNAAPSMEPTPMQQHQCNKVNKAMSTGQWQQGNVKAEWNIHRAMSMQQHQCRCINATLSRLQNFLQNQCKPITKIICNNGFPPKLSIEQLSKWWLKIFNLQIKPSKNKTAPTNDPPPPHTNIVCLPNSLYSSQPSENCNFWMVKTPKMKTKKLTKKVYA